MPIVNMFWCDVDFYINTQSLWSLCWHVQWTMLDSLDWSSEGCTDWWSLKKKHFVVVSRQVLHSTISPSIYYYQQVLSLSPGTMHTLRMLWRSVLQHWVKGKDTRAPPLQLSEGDSSRMVLNRTGERILPDRHPLLSESLLTRRVLVSTMITEFSYIILMTWLLTFLVTYHVLHTVYEARSSHTLFTCYFLDSYRFCIHCHWTCFS